jgi:hypothetical protein
MKEDCGGDQGLTKDCGARGRRRRRRRRRRINLSLSLSCQLVIGLIQSIFTHTKVYPNVSGLTAWSENRKYIALYH